MILVDTSIWVDHLRRGDAGLTNLLRDERVLTHAFVVGEIACGRLRNRSEILRRLRDVMHAPVVEDGEAHRLLELHNLAGSGLGWVDIHLLAASRIARAPLWTRDRRLAAVAARLGVSWTPV